MVDQDPQDPKDEDNDSEDEPISGDVMHHYEKVSKRMFMFPAALLKEINELIDTETITSAAKLQAVMRDRYKGNLKVPSLTVIRGYVIVRKKRKDKIDQAKQALASISPEAVERQLSDMDSQNIYQDLTLSVENKKTMLENLINLCQRRINAIQTIQENDPTSGYESVLGSYIREVRALTETLVKLRGELKTEGEKELDVYIHKKLSDVLKVVLQTYTSLHGTGNVEAFKSSLKVKLSDNDLNQMDAE